MQLSNNLMHLPLACQYDRYLKNCSHRASEGTESVLKQLPELITSMQYREPPTFVPGTIA